MQKNTQQHPANSSKKLQWKINKMIVLTGEIILGGRFSLSVVRKEPSSKVMISHCQNQQIGIFSSLTSVKHAQFHQISYLFQETWEISIT